MANEKNVDIKYICTEKQDNYYIIRFVVQNNSATSIQLAPNSVSVNSNNIGIGFDHAGIGPNSFGICSIGIASDSIIKVTQNKLAISLTVDDLVKSSDINFATKDYVITFNAD